MWDYDAACHMWHVAYGMRNVMLRVGVRGVRREPLRGTNGR